MPRASSIRTSTAVELTLEEWADMDEDEPGELVDGRLEAEEMPTFLHEAVVSWLLRVIGIWLAPLGGWVVGSEHKLAVAARRGRKPDVTLYLPGTTTPPRHASIGRRPPSAVIEVISPRPRDGKRDRVDKLRDYAAFGVRLARRSATAHRRDPRASAAPQAERRRISRRGRGVGSGV